MLFLKVFYWETDICVKLGDFRVKNVKLGRNIYIKLKIDWVETKRGVWQIITIICVTYVQKDFKIRTLIKLLLTEYQICTKLSQISHSHKNPNILSIIGTFF